MKMLRKIPINLITKTCGCKTFIRQSALLINGAKATDTFTYITPHIDFEDRLKERDNLIQNLCDRKSQVDLNKIESLWRVYEELKVRKTELDKKRDEVSKELSKLIKSDPNGEITKKYKIQIGLLKDNLKKLKVPLWSAEENAILEILKLPNSLHPLTPTTQNTILYSHLEQPNTRKDHLKIGRELNLVNFKKNENYYLKGEAAVFELGAKFYFNNILKQNKFVQFSNPDFVKSVIVEGCGGNHTSSDASFILHHNEDTKVSADNRLHLTGGGSLCSFIAFLAKNVFYPKVFPVKYFSMGRQYLPSPSDEDSLFHVSQSSVVQFFSAAKGEKESDIMLEEFIDILKTAYSQLGYHFRLSVLSADKLQMWESLRIIVEMYSSSLNSYVEVANISASGDFISKRLLLTYVEDKQSKFPYVISGTVLNVPKFLGCVLEQENDFALPEQFKVENWSIN